MDVDKQLDGSFIAYQQFVLKDTTYVVSMTFTKGTPFASIEWAMMEATREAKKTMKKQNKAQERGYVNRLL